MAEGDKYFTCDRPVPGDWSDFFAELIIEDALGNPCLKTCGDGGGGGGGVQGIPSLTDAKNTSGTLSNYKSVTFAFTDQVEIDGVMVQPDFSPITFSDDNGLADINFDATQATTGVVGGSELIIALIE